MVVLVLNRTHLKIGHTRDNGQFPYIVSKKCKKQDINLGVKKDKPQSVIYHPFMDML